MTDRDAILKRRARFVAAALASAGVVVPAVEGCAKKEAPITPPIATAHVPEADAAAVNTEELDGGALVTEVGEGPEGEDAGHSPPEIPPEHPPSVCLSPPLPPPRVCLSVPAPNPQPKTTPRICLDFNK